MRKSISLWQWGGFLFTGILGVLLHYAYDWSGESALVAPFSAINESTWEHMKLLFWPMFLYGWLEQRGWKVRYPQFWSIKLCGMLVGLAMIPIVFYTFNGAFGPSPDWYNIFIYYQSAAAAYWVETALFKRDAACPYPRFSLWVLWGIAALFLVFTFRPLALPLFVSP